MFLISTILYIAKKNDAEARFFFANGIYFILWKPILVQAHVFHNHLFDFALAAFVLLHQVGQNFVDGFEQFVVALGYANCVLLFNRSVLVIGLAGVVKGNAFQGGAVLYNVLCGELVNDNGINLFCTDCIGCELSVVKVYESGVGVVKNAVITVVVVFGCVDFTVGVDPTGRIGLSAELLACECFPNDVKITY